MMDNFTKTRNMDMEFSLGNQEMYTRATTVWIRGRVTARCIGMMGRSTRANGKMEIKKDKVF
jgi:hypothetical protein